MYAPFYEICRDDPDVVLWLGSPPRIFPFDEATQGTTSPYVVWQEIGGRPENYLAGRPDMDDYRLQIDVYGPNAADVRKIRDSLLKAIELDCHITRFNGEFRDRDTREYRSSFDVEWFVKR